MRIISGKLKGKKFEFFKSSSTRPIKDSVKKYIQHFKTFKSNKY